MPHNLTPVSQYTGDVEVPDNGDARTAESVNEAFQTLTDRAKYLYDQMLNGNMVGGDCIDSSNGTDINYNAFEVLIGNKFFSVASGSVDVGELEGGGSFANSTRYYIYVYNNAGTATFQIATTVPDTRRVFKSGTGTHRYLATFATNSSGAILPFNKRGNKYTHRFSAFPTVSPYMLLAGSATSFADIDVNVSNLLAPPHARVITVRALANNTDATTHFAEYRTKGDTAQTIQQYVVALTIDQDTFDLEVKSESGTLKFQYQVDNAGLDISLWCMGFYE